MIGNAVCVVGASGFIGRAVTALMAARGRPGTAVSRSGPEGAPGGLRSVRLPDYADRPRMAEALAGCRSAIMLAARVHVLQERDQDPAAAFLRANRDLPLLVAEELAKAGGRRFVFVSSLAVNGVATRGRPITDADAPTPVTDYGRSKWMAEQALTERCAELGLELSILRPPMVYGPRAPGQYGRLLGAVRRGLPLPFRSIRNRRDMIGIDNFADLLLLAADHPAAAGETFLVADGEPVSTGRLARLMVRASGRRGRVFPCPPAVLRAAARLANRPQLAERLLDDLQLDSSRVRTLLGWTPPVTLEEGIRRSVQDG